jgi:membrane-bound serine protease (ClpP class)
VRKAYTLLFLIISSLAQANSTVPVIQVSDTINPGTADYIISQIDRANTHHNPYIILQLDTPGGLLNSTRQIIQAMLNSKVPVVVWIGPKGAQAGSAGALISFAADVAAMAPGTNIGAAHPIGGDGREMNKTLSEKVTNDTAAFAESLAKAKGRNSEWAKQSVYSSQSIPSGEAEKNNVIDFVVNDLNALEVRMRGYQLKASKDALSLIASEARQLTIVPPTLKNQVVSFFANPSLAYVILSLGGLCIWIELSHPGLIVPGIVGSLCVLLSLVSFQLLPIRFGALGMLLLGIALLVAELYVTSYGALGIGGIAAFILGSLYLMDTNVPEFQISSLLIFPTATCLATIVFLLSYFIWKSRKITVPDSYHSFVGILTEANSEITAHAGNVFIQGELWAARTPEGSAIPKGTQVLITEVKGLILTVVAKEKN